MELRHLRYFIRAAELLNFTKAAESLYVSQPTLSVQIHQLEQELGAELFARTGRTVRLTQAGTTFLHHAQQAVRQLEEGAKEVDALTGLLRGSLNVAALPLIGSKLVPDLVSLFKEQHPNVAVHVRSGTSEDIETRILNGSVDIGIATKPTNTELSWTELFTDETVLMVSRDHKLAGRKSASVKDLQNLPMAVPSERITTSIAMGKFFEDQGVEPRIEMTYDDGHALLELIKKGRLVTILPRWAALNEADIVPVSLPSPGIQIVVGAVWQHLGPASKAFLELVRKQTTEMNVNYNLPPSRIPL